MGLKVVLWTHEPKKDGECDVKLYINNAGKKKYYSLEISVHPTNWNESDKRAKKDTLNVDLINPKITDAYSAFERLMLQHPNATPIKLIQIYEKDKNIRKDKITLLEFLENYIELCKAGKITHPKKGTPIKKNTYKGYGNLLTRLNLFCTYERYIDFEDIDMEFYRDYLYFLRFKVYDHLPEDERPEDRKGLSENSIGTDIKNLKLIMNQAYSKGHTKNQNHKLPGFITIDEEVDSIVLEPGEVKAIENLDLSQHPHLVEERDRSLCAYNFLLRFNDSIAFSEGNIITNDRGNFLHIRTTKTGEKVLVPIKSKTMDILKRNNFKMPDITNQESNWKLKELGKLADIDAPTTIYEHREGKVIPKTVPKYELMGTHIWRRAGATHMYEAGVPIKVIMDIGGWRTEEEFFKYIRIRKSKSAEIAAAHPFFS